MAVVNLGGDFTRKTRTEAGASRLSAPRVRHQEERVQRINGRVVVVTAEIDDLWRQGFGSVETAAGIARILSASWRESRLAVVNSGTDLAALASDRPDLVFSGINYVPRDDGAGAHERLWVSQVMAGAGINFTGSERPVLELVLDKARTKEVLQRCGIPTARYFTATPGEYRCASELPVAPPLFVKPLCEGDGRGIGPDSIARSYEDYERKVQAICEEWGQPAIAETYLDGREFTVARLGGTDADPNLMPLELVVEAVEDGGRILGFQAKKDNRELVLAVPEGALRDELLSVSGRAFKALGNRDYGRIDLRMDAQGRLNVLEANFIPGLTDRYSYLPLACGMYSGMRYEETITEIARTAFTRGAGSTGS